MIGWDQELSHSFPRAEACGGQAADPGGQHPPALGPRVLGRQADPDHDVPVRAEDHRREGLWRLLGPHQFSAHPHCPVR